MNIFILSENPTEAAQLQLDKHVVKMCLETAQMLSTIADGPYKPTHKNHPCTVWARTSKQNYEWLVLHGLALCEEYTYRYGKIHKCESIISSLSDRSVRFPNIGLTKFAMAMPDDLKSSDVVESYKKYYKTKSSFAKWTKRSVPSWWNNGE